MDARTLAIALETVARSNRDVATAYKRVGMPAPRQSNPGFESLVRILVGQQLSVKAAASIHGRFETLLEGNVTPRQMLATTHEDLRSVGLSNAKVRYCQALAQAIEAGTLDIAGLSSLDEPEAMQRLTAVKGIGPWTAQIYLLFCEGRPNIWPAGDLALQESLKRLKGLKERPDAKATLPLVAPWEPYRGAMAVFLWHYYAASEAPV